MAKIIEVNGIQIKHQSVNQEDYLSLTDLAKFKTDKPDRVIERWMRTRMRLII